MRPSSLQLVVAAALIAAPLLTPHDALAQPHAPVQSAAVEQQFTILIFESPALLATRNGAQQDAYWSSYDEFAAALVRGGVLRGGSALSETTASTVRGTGSVDAAVRGARLGGYFVIAAKDITDANRWASLAPKAALLVEVRPHRNNPHMAQMAPR